MFGVCLFFSLAQSREDLPPGAGLAPHPDPAPQILQDCCSGLELPLSFAGCMSQLAWRWILVGAVFALAQGAKRLCSELSPRKQGGQAPPNEACFPLWKASYAGRANACPGAASGLDS